MIDLFTCLNLNIKGKSYMELEDFLYFFDNFSFLFKESLVDDVATQPLPVVLFVLFTLFKEYDDIGC
jgi:hypothetical protein